jgi:hypothetical protein
MPRKYFKTIITIEVLSEDAPVDVHQLTMQEIEYRYTYGDWSASVDDEVQELTREQVEEELLSQGSSPEFFPPEEEE